MRLFQQFSGFAKTFRSALLTHWQDFSDSGVQGAKRAILRILQLSSRLTIDPSGLSEWSRWCRMSKHPLPPFGIFFLSPLDMRIHQVPPNIYYTHSKNRDWVIRFLGYLWWFLRNRIWLKGRTPVDQLQKTGLALRSFVKGQPIQIRLTPIFFGFQPQSSTCAFLWAKLGFIIFVSNS